MNFGGYIQGMNGENFEGIHEGYARGGSHKELNRKRHAGAVIVSPMLYRAYTNDSTIYGKFHGDLKII